MKLLGHGLTFGLMLLIATADGPRLQVKADRTEAEAALQILDQLARAQEPSSEDWQRLFNTAGYRRLKEREAAMNRSFTDAEFMAFLHSPEASAKTPGWHKALAAWGTDLAGPAALKAFAYLPANASLRATIFPMIKPRPNEFVFDLGGSPAIFLYLNPEVTAAKAANTMAHELHHIGLGSACSDEAESKDAGVKELRHWIGAFGEGLAMLAAAGGPNIHPHTVSLPDERAEWDSNIGKFDEQIADQNAFFLKVLAGTAGDSAAIQERMTSYFGKQGPWYTVGWRMAKTIEDNLGRPRLIDAFCRSETLLLTYNEAAMREKARTGAALPLWDQILAARVAGANLEANRTN